MTARHVRCLRERVIQNCHSGAKIRQWPKLQAKFLFCKDRRFSLNTRLLESHTVQLNQKSLSLSLFRMHNLLPRRQLRLYRLPNPNLHLVVPFNCRECQPFNNPSPEALVPPCPKWPRFGPSRPPCPQPLAQVFTRNQPSCIRQVAQCPSPPLP